MTKSAQVLIFVGVAAAPTTGCPPEAEISIGGDGFSHGSETFAALPAPPSARCLVPGGFYEAGSIDKVDLCFPAVNWYGDIPCSVDQPEFLRIRFESPREACAGSVDVMDSDMILRGWLEGSGGVAEVQSIFAEADLESCGEAIRFQFGLGPWLCDSESEVSPNGALVSGSWSFPTPQRRQP